MGICQNRFDTRRPNFEFACAKFGVFRNYIPAANDLELGESGLQVSFADVTGANDSNVHLCRRQKVEVRRQNAKGIVKIEKPQAIPLLRQSRGYLLNSVFCLLTSPFNCASYSPRLP